MLKDECILKEAVLDLIEYDSKADDLEDLLEVFEGKAYSMHLSCIDLSGQKDLMGFELFVFSQSLHTLRQVMDTCRIPIPK